MFAGNSALADKKYEKLTILHTNDVHSNIEPFPFDHPTLGGLGGFERRAVLVDRIRQQNHNVILLDAGDLFQGTPFFNFFKGELEVSLMNRLGYDASTLGNHEFDLGTDNLIAQFSKLNYPVLCCNYTIAETRWSKILKPYTIIERNGFKIGIIGVCINPKGLIDPGNFAGITYQPYTEPVNKLAAMLKQKMHCNVVIALTHIGIQDDKKLAAESKNVDVILGGHSHTFLDEPLFVNNAESKPVLIGQAGFGGAYLGQVDVVKTS